MGHKPFTYEHFIQAIQSFRDDMLMYYIDDAVGIYCTMKGISVGRRPASSRDYSQEYSDAFEAANYAVYKVARKIGSYNPDEGDFKKYLDSALGNAFKDIFKADGYGSMSNEDIENEPDTSASDAEERVRRHKDDAFETMIRFIDTLPEIKRAAVYASAFGQILRPDLEGYGRNYADILAGIYHTTALYIRQLATEGKKAALAEARRQGFSERSMNEVYMGMLQAKVPARDLNDEVLQATDQLNPYQQFMLLRHLSQMANNNNVNNNNINTKTNKVMSTWGDMRRRAEGKEIRREDECKTWDELVSKLERRLSNDDADDLGLWELLWELLKNVEDPSKIDGGIEITEEKGTLKPEETLLLKAIAAIPFTLGVYNSLEEVINQLEVKIIIDHANKVRYHSALDENKKELKYWQEILDSLKDKEDSPEYKEAKKMCDYYNREVGIWGKVLVLGEYIPPRYDGYVPVIKLYPEVMRNICERLKTYSMNEFLVTTFVHEVMHAYFDRPMHSRHDFQHFSTDEEPMAEFGTLLYLYETKQRLLFIWAFSRISIKKTYYRYGAALMDQYLKDVKPSKTREDLEVYRIRKY